MTRTSHNRVIKISEASNCSTSYVFLDFIYNHMQATCTWPTMRLSFWKSLSHTQLFCSWSKEIDLFSYKLKTNQGLISIYKESKTNHKDSTLRTEIVALKGEWAYFRPKCNTQVISVLKKNLKTKEQWRRNAFIYTMLNLLPRSCRTIFNY